MRDLWRHPEDTPVERRDLVVGEVLRPADFDRLPPHRPVGERAHGHRRDVADRDEVARSGAPAKQRRLAPLDDPLAVEGVRVRLHERRRPQDGVAQARPLHVLLDRVLGAKEIHRMAGRGAQRGCVDEMRDARRSRGIHQRTVARIVDGLGAIAAAAQHPVRGGHHVGRARAGARQRRGVHQVALHDLRTQARKVRRLRRLARHRPHGPALGAQPPHDFPTEHTGRPDHEDHADGFLRVTSRAAPAS